MIERFEDESKDPATILYDTQNPLRSMHGSFSVEHPSSVREHISKIGMYQRLRKLQWVLSARYKLKAQRESHARFKLEMTYGCVKRDIDHLYTFASRCGINWAIPSS